MLIDWKIEHYLYWTETEYEYNVAGDITFVDKDNPWLVSPITCSLSALCHDIIENILR